MKRAKIRPFDFKPIVCPWQGDHSHQDWRRVVAFTGRLEHSIGQLGTFKREPLEAELGLVLSGRLIVPGNAFDVECQRNLVEG